MPVVAANLRLYQVGARTQQRRVAQAISEMNRIEEVEIGIMKSTKAHGLFLFCQQPFLTDIITYDSHRLPDIIRQVFCHRLSPIGGF